MSGEDNVVSGNGRHGLYVSGGSGNDLGTNEVGTDGTGTVDVGNAGHGLYLEDTDGSVITNSLISGNAQDGLRIVAGGGHTVVVRGGPSTG